MRRVLTQLGLAVVLAATLGAEPGLRTSESAATVTPELPTAPVQPKVAAQLMNPVPEAKAVLKPYEVGNASWYGEMFQGRLTANGEEFDMNKLTAAHRELPLGTWIKVTNLRNRKSVVVRVNDRGPVVPGRVLDLSYSAAKILKMAGHGVAKVRIDVVKLPDSEVASNLNSQGQ